MNRPEFGPEDQALEQEIAANRQAYEQLKEQLQGECAGKYVALAFGRLVGTAETYGDAIALIQQLEPAPKSFEIFLGDQEPLFDTIRLTYQEFV